MWEEFLGVKITRSPYLLWDVAGIRTVVLEPSLLQILRPNKLKKVAGASRMLTYATAIDNRQEPCDCKHTLALTKPRL